MTLTYLGREISQAAVDNFWKKVEILDSPDTLNQDNHWLWKGYTRRGWNARWRPGQGWPYVQVHRYLYETEHGPVPEGFLILPDCGMQACVNPDHQRACTKAEAYRDGLINNRGWGKNR